MASQQTLEVMNPDADIDRRKVRAARRVSRLDGKKIGLVSNRKAGANWMLDTVAQRLAEQCTSVRFERFDFAERPFTPLAIEQMTNSGCDAFVASSAD